MATTSPSAMDHVSKKPKLADGEDAMDVDDKENRKIAKVGQGTYGAVYRAWDFHRGLTVAMKKISLKHADVDTLRFATREI